MGGLNSGRPRKHTCIDDCIVLDLAQLKKQKLLTPGRYELQSKKWTITDYHKKKDHAYTFGLLIEDQQMTICYQTVQSKTGKHLDHDHSIALTSTACQYGGSRLWFVAPCCGSRVRVLYINPRRGPLEQITPQCRRCLDLHYESQMSSYIERHKTYERHLLANYGYSWAALRYDFELKAHYLEMTPELRMLKAQSQCARQLELLCHLLRFNRLFIRMHTRALDSLKSEEDTMAYTLHMLQEWGPGHVEQVRGRLRKPAKRAMVAQILTTWRSEGKQSNATIDFTEMLKQKRELEAELQALKAA